MTTRLDVVRVAQEWIGTPFHHCGRVKGLGVDCAGLLIGVARELGLVSPEFDVNDYGRVPDGSTLTRFCKQYLDPIPKNLLRSGDVLVMAIDEDPQHLGIINDYKHGGNSLIHAACRRDGVGEVIETRLMWHRRQRFVAAYSFRGLND